MRITWLLDDSAAPGGLEASALAVAGVLAQRHDVRVLSLLSPGPSGAAAPAPPHLDVVPLLARTADDPTPTGSALSPGAAGYGPDSDAALERALRAESTDVVVTTSAPLQAAAARLLPPGTALVHHEGGTSSSRGASVGPLLDHLDQADAVVVLTPSMAAWLRGRSAPAPLGAEVVDIALALPAGHAPRSLGDGRLVMTSTRLTPDGQVQKLVHAFAEAAGRLPGWRLRVYGEGRLRWQLLRQARREDLYDRLELPGTVPDMRTEWAQASVAAFTSRWSGPEAPWALQQAMAAGVPPVAFDAPDGARHWVRHGVDGLLTTPDTVAGLASALVELGEDDATRHRLGAAAAATSAQWRPDAVAARWEELLQRVVDRRAGRSRLEVREQASPAADEQPTPPASSGSGDIASLTPDEARRLALDAAVACARTVTDAWFVLPRHGTPTPVVVVPMQARDAFLAALAAAPLPGYLSLLDPGDQGWPDRLGPVPELAERLRHGRTSRLVLGPWPTADGRATHLGVGCAVEVQFWTESPDDDLVAPRPNLYASRFTRTEVREAPRDTEVDGVRVRTFPVMTTPTPTEVRGPVDVVYTWVDGADPRWDQARQRRLDEADGGALRREAGGRARFTSHDELRYSMRSLHLFAPWVRRIHLVTAGQAPSWLDTTHPQVQLVDHHDILPAEALPTFNSHAIETGLHRVPDLSEQFVYFNDDVLLGRPVGPETFFGPGGHFASFFSTVPIGPSRTGDVPPFLAAAWNNRALLQDAFGVHITHTMAHSPHPHRRSVLAEIAERFAADVDRTARSPFRSAGDVSLLSSLAQHYGVLTGSSFVGTGSLAFVNLGGSDLPRQLQQLLETRDHDFICLADDHDHAMRAGQLEEVLGTWCEAYYPVRAPWEVAEQARPQPS